MEAGRLGRGKGVVVVIVDTNTLILMARGLIAPSMIGEALETSYKLVAPRGVRRELERLAEAHPRPLVKRYSKTALELARRLGVEWVDAEAGRDVDDSIEALARALKAEGARVVVATSDRGLRRRLKRLGIPTLYYRESEGMLQVDWSPL
jgi:rRNA-processing protein FCF1